MGACVVGPHILPQRLTGNVYRNSSYMALSECWKMRFCRKRVVYAKRGSGTFCCILRGPGGERIVDVVPGRTELELHS